MSKNMQSKPTTPSVIARLMGLDELLSQQPVYKQKRQRVLSENYRRKVASIGVWEKRSFDERHSFRFSIEEQKEFKDAFEVTDKGSDSFAGKGRVDLRSSREKISSISGSFTDSECVSAHIKLQPLKEVHSGQSEPGFVDPRMDCLINRSQKLDNLTTKHFHELEVVPSQLQSGHARFLDPSYAFHREKIESYKKVGGATDEENPKLLWKLDNRFVQDFRRRPDSTCMVPRFHLESNNKRCHSFRKIVILKPKPGEAENATNHLSSPGSNEGSCSGDRKDKSLFLNCRKRNSHAQVKASKNFLNGVKSGAHRSVLSCEAEKEITPKTRPNISDVPLEPPRFGFSGAHSLSKESELMISSLNNSDVNTWFKPSCHSLDGSYVTWEAKQQISERWRMTKEFRENGLTSGGGARSRTLGEMLALPYHVKQANFLSPLGISSRDGWKNGGIGDIIKSRSQAYSTSVESPVTRTSHKAFHDDSYMTMRPMCSLNWSRVKSTKQGSSGKDGLKQRNSGSNCKQSQSGPDLESEKKHSLANGYVIHSIFKNNFGKEDPSEENSYLYKSLKHDIGHSNSENGITPINQGNDIKDRKMSAEGCRVPESSMYSAASPSIVSDAVVAVGIVGAVKSTGTHNQQQFESTGCIMSAKDCDSSPCIPDAWSRQEDIPTKMSKECGTNPDFLVNFETANQPSPVSVLEAPFIGGNLPSSKCFMSVTASLHDVKQKLEFLKSESHEGYSEGPGMVLSSDDDNDAGGESLEDCEVNEYQTGLFGAEESRDFSYLVDVLTEAGFHGRNQDIGFNGWHSPEIPINPSVFETLEKKYGEHISWRRSARRILFDRINSGLMEIFQPCLGNPMWSKPVARRLSYRQDWKEIEKELYMLLVSHENEAKKDSSEKVFGKDDGWLFLGYDIELIGREIENSLIDELAAEIVSSYVASTPHFS